MIQKALVAPGDAPRRYGGPNRVDGPVHGSHRGRGIHSASRSTVKTLETWAWAGLAIVVVGAIVIDATGGPGLAPVLEWFGELSVGLAVLGLAVSTASLLSGFRYKVLAILGLVACGAVRLVELGLALFL